KTVLNNNLFGVDLNGESVEITKLSLWLKTAQQGKKLTYLDRNIKAGNSIVADPKLDRRAFDWKRGRVSRERLEGSDHTEATKEIDARWQEGFDVVIGNPPYVRQELLTPIKEHLKEHYAAYHGMADLFVYFFERGLSVLKPRGRLGFVVSNKWLKGEYAAPLRKMLSKEAQIERIIDFGHAPIFPDADAFPSIITLQKPDGALPKDASFNMAIFPREELKTVSVREYVTQNSQATPQARLDASQWSLEPPGPQRLMQRMRERGIPLTKYLGAKPWYGVKTGFNDAFMVSDETRRQLIQDDPRSAEILVRLLRGQDIGRWIPATSGSWLIFARRGIDIERYPAIKRHLERFRTGLEPKPKNWTEKEWPGRKPGTYQWYELQDPVDYYELFARPKIIYQVIQFYPQYALDVEGFVLNDKGFFIPTNDLWLLAVLNSPLLWWFNWRYLGHMKDEALNPAGVKMETLPIAEPSNAARKQTDEIVPQLIEFTRASQVATAALLDSLRLQYGVEKAGQKLEDFAELSTDAFIKEILARRPRGSSAVRPAQLTDLRSVHAEEAEAMRRRRAEMLNLERRLATLVMEAYKLSAADVRLMWETAPPRMPLEPFNQVRSGGSASEGD
ncbi:MAG: restriction endonuclease, partial [Verrucomicrobiaceae bacterium]